MQQGHTDSVSHTYIVYYDRVGKINGDLMHPRLQSNKLAHSENLFCTMQHIFKKSTFQYQ